jgi:hypothetical protein
VVQKRLCEWMAGSYGREVLGKRTSKLVRVRVREKGARR